MPIRFPILFGATLTAAVAAGGPAFAQGQSCNEEATRLRRAEAELPKLDVAPPDDKQIVYITLETNVLFARRLKAHLKNCPRSPYARSANDWANIDTSYTARFESRDCPPTICGYRG